VTGQPRISTGKVMQFQGALDYLRDRMVEPHLAEPQELKTSIEGAFLPIVVGPLEEVPAFDAAEPQPVPGGAKRMFSPRPGEA